MLKYNYVVIHEYSDLQFYEKKAEKYGNVGY